MKLRTTTTTLAAVATLLVAVPATAFAQEAPDQRVPDRLGWVAEDRPDGDEVSRSLKARALAAIEKRLETIDRLQGAIRDSEHITTDHAAELQRQLTAAAQGLTELARQIQAATDPETLRELIQKIEDYHIYGLVVPKVHLVIGADTASAVADRLEEVAAELARAVEWAEGEGYDVADAKAALARMVAKVESGARAAQAVADIVMPLTPEDWPEAKTVLEEAYRLLASARTDLRAAGALAHEVVAALRDAMG